MDINRQYVEQMIGQMAPDQLDAVVHLLQAMVDPVAHTIANAPVEDEDITQELAAELDAAHASIARGEGVPHEEILRQFGLTPER